MSMSLRISYDVLKQAEQYSMERALAFLSLKGIQASGWTDGFAGRVRTSQFLATAIDTGPETKLVTYRNIASLHFSEKDNQTVQDALFYGKDFNHTPDTGMLSRSFPVLSKIIDYKADIFAFGGLGPTWIATYGILKRYQAHNISKKQLAILTRKAIKELVDYRNMPLAKRISN